MTNTVIYHANTSCDWQEFNKISCDIEPANSEPNPTDTLIQCLVLLQNFKPWQQKNLIWKVERRFLREKKTPNSPYFERKNMMSPYLDNRSFQQNKAWVSKQKISTFQTSSQIWLIPLVDDCHFTYFTKLKIIIIIIINKIINLALIRLLYDCSGIYNVKGFSTYS